jgi:hypothetical protein
MPEEVLTTKTATEPAETEASVAGEPVDIPVEADPEDEGPVERRESAPRKRSMARKKIRAKTLEQKAGEPDTKTETRRADAVKKTPRRGIRLKNLDDTE